MATRDLQTNHQAINKTSQRILQFTSNSLENSYKKALVQIRAEIARLYEAFDIAGELTRSQQAQFIRASGIQESILRIMGPAIDGNIELLGDASQLGFDQAFYRSSWAIDQATGVNIGFGQVSDNAVRAVAGIGGDVADLTGFIAESEVISHKKIMDNAFTNYGKDTRTWIQEDIRQGIINGDSVPQITKRLSKNSLIKSYNSAERIARTEVLRSTGLGNQMAYEASRDQGVEIKEVWDATLDDRTRPDHAAADGAVRDNVTGMFSVPWGDVPGPRRSGIASEDISCRCDSNPQIEGFSPEVRRVRGEGIVPYQTFKTWAKNNNLTTNRFGQKYNFKE